MAYAPGLAEYAGQTIGKDDGKGANLGAMAKAGLPVPEGFTISTDGYDKFVAANALAERISALLSGIGFCDLDSLDRQSAAIHSTRSPTRS